MKNLKLISILLFTFFAFSCKKDKTNNTPDPVISTLSTTDITEITTTTASSGGNISNNGGANVTVRGVCWSTTANPTIANPKTTNGTGSGTFTSAITGLTPNTTYHVRAYATNSAGTAYGNDITFTTSTPIVISTLTTTALSAITATTASSGGNISNNGGANVTARGVCWSTTANPTTANPKTTDGTGSGTFTSAITGLTPNTTYYLRAYATNSAGTAYGEEISFKTTNTVNLATIQTVTVSAITFNSAISGGNITNDGGASITRRGVVWSTSSNPTTENNKTTIISGAGSFTSNITGLTPNTTYYVRAYATNSAGTAYGEEISFKTTNSVLATIQTTTVSAVTSNSAISGGNITSDGGATVTARGVVWSTSSNPTTANNKTTNGSGTGSFTSAITGLTPNTTYYVRAYATNSAGTAYGTQLSFTTTVASSSNLYLNPNLTYGSVTDIDGNKYATIKIGNKTWMAENLKTSKYNDGTAIPNVKDNTQWEKSYSGAYCYYDNNINNEANYGKLYNWYAVNTGKLCPSGWHIPTNSDWFLLLNNYDGIKLKAKGNKTDGTGLWTKNIGTEGTNESGFTALPGGNRTPSGTFNTIGGGAYWWGSEKFNVFNASVRYLYYFDSNVNSGNYSMSQGFSCRCVKD